MAGKLLGEEGRAVGEERKRERGRRGKGEREKRGRGGGEREMGDMKEQEEEGERERKGTSEQGYLPFWTSLGSREVQPYRNFFF